MSRPGSADRQAQRRQRLIEAEKEQLQEDQEALKITEDQRQTLLTSFASVKTQFFDLDGLRWTSSALRKRAHQQPQSVPRKPQATPFDDGTALSPLTNTLSASTSDESWEDTIRPGGDLSALLSAYYADTKTRSPPPKADRPKHPLSHEPQSAPQYITYSKPSSSNSSLGPPLTSSPTPSEQPTPRPRRTTLGDAPPSPSPQPSLKRRLSSSREELEVPNEHKRAHTALEKQGITV